MLNFLFWNVNRQPIASLVTKLVSEHRVSILAVAECGGIDTVQLLRDLNQAGIEYYSASSSSDRVAIFTKFDPMYLMTVNSHSRMSIHRLTLPDHPEVLLGVAHLPSKMYMSDSDQSDLASRGARMVEEVERSEGHSRTILFGDFNMNPFERGMAGSEIFHAIMDQRIARKQFRKVDGEERRFFYNPMWSKMGDLTEGPPGTYYYGGSGPLTYFWNTFDQVLIRPSLMDRLDTDKLSVVTRVGTQTLLDEDGRPDKRVGSDHLPLIFSLDLPLET